MITLTTRKDFFDEHPGMVIAELGVYKGEFSREILDSDPEMLYMVDIWRGAQSSADKNGKNNTQVWNMYELYVKLLHDIRGQNVTIVRSKSVDFLNAMPDDSLDCVYIDSDHSYETTIAELWASVPKVKPDGWITGHDYVDLAPGVIKAVDEFLEKTGYEIEFMTEDGCPSWFIINKK